MIFISPTNLAVTWNGFPYYYTLLMLSQVDDPLASQELKYATPLCEKLQGRIGSDDSLSKRRLTILSKALSRN